MKSPVTFGRFDTELRAIRILSPVSLIRQIAPAIVSAEVEERGHNLLCSAPLTVVVLITRAEAKCCRFEKRMWVYKCTHCLSVVLCCIAPPTRAHCSVQRSCCRMSDRDEGKRLPGIRWWNDPAWIHHRKKILFNLTESAAQLSLGACVPQKLRRGLRAQAVA